MIERSPLEEIARLHRLTFDNAERHMDPDRLVLFTGWVATHPDYIPTFGTRLESATEWTRQNPEAFISMVKEFDAALDFMNSRDAMVDETLFVNVATYRNRRKGILPRIGGEDEHDASQILATARSAGSKLRWGETIRPTDGNYYGFHTFVKSDRGMVAASLTDLYENYTRTLGLYPDDASGDSIVANAITEAVYLTNPDGELFQTYKNPDDGWIYGYEGFSQQFQDIVYGQAAAK